MSSEEELSDGEEETYVELDLEKTLTWTGNAVSIQAGGEFRLPLIVPHPSVLAIQFEVEGGYDIEFSLTFQDDAEESSSVLVEPVRTVDREGQLDILLLDYRAVIATHLLSLVVCLFLRMYGVMMSAYPADFPDVRSYWRSGVYPAMLLCHTAASLVFYATTVSSVHQLGEGSHFFFRGPAARRAAEEARLAANK